MDFFNDKKFKECFQIFEQEQNLVYFDNASTHLKPKILLDSYQESLNLYGNLDRSLGTGKLDEKIERSLQTMSKYFNCQKENIIFTSGASDSLNFLSEAIFEHLVNNIQELSQNTKNQNTEENIAANEFYFMIHKANHHSNILPWICLKDKLEKEVPNLKIHIKNFSITENNNISYPEVENELKVSKGKVLLSAISTVNNTDGIYNQPSLLANLCKEYNPTSIFIVDHAQAGIFNLQYPISSINVDFYLGSFHKMFGPTGLGYLIINNANLKSKLQSKRLGGGVVEEVEWNEDLLSWEYSQEGNYKLAGTQNMQAIYQIHDLLNWWQEQDIALAYQHCLNLTHYLKEKLVALNIEVLPCAGNIVNIAIPHGEDIDLALLLAQQDIVTRVGKHCAHPWHHERNIDSSLRISFAPYNSYAEIDKFLDIINQANKLGLINLNDR